MRILLKIIRRSGWLVLLPGILNAPGGATAAQDTQKAPAAEKASFVPPPDGHLTVEQVRTYIVVRKRSGSRSHSSAPPDPTAIARQMEREFAAAREVGMGPAEYRWVSARIAEALGPEVSKGQDPALQVLAPAVTQAAGSLAAGEANAAATPSDPEALAYNRALVAQYRSQLK